MAAIAHIVKKALQDTGIYISEGDSVPDDYYKPTVEMLRDLIAELNTQSAIQFTQQEDDVFVSGRVLTFKPYTDAEQAIIDGGGSVDTTDRMTDFTPLTNPIVLKDGCTLAFMSYRDVLGLKDESDAVGYAFNVKSDSSELVFNSNVGGTVTILRSVPIEIDDTPFGDVHIPDAYVHYLVTKLSEMVATRYQFSDTAALFAAKANQSGNILANNNTSRRPVRRNLIAGLNKFNRY